MMEKDFVLIGKTILDLFDVHDNVLHENVYLHRNQGLITILHLQIKQNNS